MTADVQAGHGNTLLSGIIRKPNLRNRDRSQGSRLVYPAASKQAHDEYHADAGAWEARYGTHVELLKAFWEALGITPGDWMSVGMPPKRKQWLERVLARLGVDG
jgi:hypothetical protein